MSEESNWKEAYKQQQRRTGDAKQKTTKIRPLIQKDTAPRTSASTARTVRKVVFTILIGVSVIQWIIWAVICIALQRFMSPWWLWSTIPALLIMGIVWAATKENN